MDDRARFEAFAGLATEQRNPRTLDLDTLDVPGILARISAEDRTVPDAVARELPYVARAVELVVESFRGVAVSSTWARAPAAVWACSTPPSVLPPSAAIPRPSSA